MPTREREGGDTEGRGSARTSVLNVHQAPPCGLWNSLTEETRNFRKDLEKRQLILVRTYKKQACLTHEEKEEKNRVV